MQICNRVKHSSDGRRALRCLVPNAAKASVRLCPFDVHTVFLIQFGHFYPENPAYLHDVVTERLEVTCANSTDLTRMHPRYPCDVGIAEILYLSSARNSLLKVANLLATWFHAN